MANWESPQIEGLSTFGAEGGFAGSGKPKEDPPSPYLNTTFRWTGHDGGSHSDGHVEISNIQGQVKSAVVTMVTNFPITKIESVSSFGPCRVEITSDYSFKIYINEDNIWGTNLGNCAINFQMTSTGLYYKDGKTGACGDGAYGNESPYYCTVTNVLWVRPV